MTRSKALISEIICLEKQIVNWLREEKQNGLIAFGIVECSSV